LSRPARPHFNGCIGFILPYGTLAKTRLDIDFHVRHRIRVVSAVVPAGVLVGERVDLLSGERGAKSWESE
jgi:hypothetical protein